MRYGGFITDEELEAAGYMTVESAMKALKVGRASVFTYANDGSLRSYTVGRRRAFLADDIETFIKSRAEALSMPKQTKPVERTRTKYTPSYLPRAAPVLDTDWAGE